jgi:hypothetical protein
MPEALEKKLKAQVAKKDWSQERKDAYIYGTMRKTGWVPSTQKKHKKKPSNKSYNKESINMAMQMMRK